MTAVPDIVDANWSITDNRVIGDTERRLFASLTTDELLAMATKTDPVRCNWNQWDRSMLLAFFHNRFGRFVPQVSS